MEENLERESGDSELSDGDKTFPGLNKAHGFFSLIERNQRDRDTYHQEQEEWKEARRLAVKRDWRNDRESKRPQRHPSKALYCPPHQRKPDAPRLKKFRLEVELHPNMWWRGVVQCGAERQLADQLAKEHDLSPPIRDTLLNMMLEFTQAHL